MLSFQSKGARMRFLLLLTVVFSALSGAAMFAADPAPPLPATAATQPAADASPARSLPGRPTVKPAEAQNVVVSCEPGRYGGWPANGGVWSWGNEIVVGFTVGWLLLQRPPTLGPHHAGHDLEALRPKQNRLTARSAILLGRFC
jgi:hypothetical protein